MILIADSGSTKCDWIVVEGTQQGCFRTRGINAIVHTPEQIRESLAEFSVCGTPEEVWFYGAGGGSQFPEATQALARLLTAYFNTPRVEVHSDLMGAARALCGREAGIACVLGTGANSCYYDGETIVENVPPLGYVLGDEGGGAVLGRNLVNGIFKGHIPLRAEFLSAYGLTYEEVIHRVYCEPLASRFLASFAPFIRKHLACEEVREMVERAFGEFVERNLRHYPAGLPVSFVGGIACNFEEVLRCVLDKYGFQIGRITASPAGGLITYHCGK